MLKRWLKEYVEINKQDIVVIISLLIIGIIIGIGLYVFSSGATKDLAFSTVKEVFDISKSETYVKTNIISNGIKADILLIVLLAILSVTLVGKWIMYILLMAKGAALSVYTILLFKIFGPWWGIIVFLLLVVLVNLLYLPALIYLFVNFLEVHFNVFKAKIRDLSVTKILLETCLSFVIMFSSIILEQLTSTIALSIYTKL